MIKYSKGMIRVCNVFDDEKEYADTEFLFFGVEEEYKSVLKGETKMNELNLLQELPNNVIVRSIAQTIAQKQELLTCINDELAKLRQWEQAMEQQHGYGSSEHESVLAVYRTGVRILSRSLETVIKYGAFDFKTEYAENIVDAKNAEKKYNGIDWNKIEANLPAEERLFTAEKEVPKKLTMSAFKLLNPEPELSDLRSER